MVSSVSWLQINSNKRIVENIKKLTFNMSEPFANNEDLDLLPPPKFSPLPLPFHYGYKQNTGVMVVSDGKGGQKVVNVKSYPKLFSTIISANGPAPLGPAEELKNQPITDPNVKECYEELVKLFEERPIWTRRALKCHLSENCREHLKYAIQRVAYGFRGGPWRSTNVKYGVDPRSDPKYRLYQTRYFRLMQTEEEETRRTRRRGEAWPYEFDGKHMPVGTLFQLCDVTDPQLKELIENCALREEPDIVDGWFESLPYERIISLFRAKIQACKDHVSLSEEAIHDILSKERTDADREDAENDDNEAFDSEIENENENENGNDNDANAAAGKEFADKLEESEKSLAANEPGVSKTHNEVSVTNVDDTAKIRDLFGYVQQHSAVAPMDE